MQWNVTCGGVTKMSRTKGMKGRDEMVLWQRLPLNCKRFIFRIFCGQQSCKWVVGPGRYFSCGALVLERPSTMIVQLVRICLNATAQQTED